MKRAFLLLGLVLVFVMTACGKKGNGGETTPQSTTTQQTESIPETTGTDQQETSPAGNTGTASMEELKNAVVEVLGENYWPNTVVEEEIFGDMFGVTPDMYEEFFAETPMISTNVDTLVIVKAKEGQVEAVETALNSYRDTMINDTMQYPMNVGKIQASRIETFGNYVCFVQLGADVSDVLDQGDEAVITKCQEENEKALEAIRLALSK